jgi:hypothetical protein
MPETAWWLSIRVTIIGSRSSVGQNLYFSPDDSNAAICFAMTLSRLDGGSEHGDIVLQRDSLEAFNQSIQPIRNRILAL